MNLTKENWNKKHGEEFESYLTAKQNLEKVEWTRKIINTNKPLLAIPTPELKKIAKEILKGNYLEFLKLNMYKYYENVAINGFIISNIKDFNEYTKQLTNYINYVDNWANCDLLTFKVNAKNEKQFFEYSLNLFKSNKTFARRIGVNIWFKFITPNYLPKIFKIINNTKEDEYYVNMCIAWFLAECFIKQREITLQLFKQNNIDKFTINKAISKCRDSYRVTKVDKEMLLSYKK